MKYLKLIVAAIFGAGVAWKARSVIADNAEKNQTVYHQQKMSENFTYAFGKGWESSKDNLLWMVDKDLYERFYGHPHPLYED